MFVHHPLNSSSPVLLIPRRIMNPHRHKPVSPYPWPSLRASNSLIFAKPLFPWPKIKCVLQIQRSNTVPLLQKSQQVLKHVIPTHPRSRPFRSDGDGRQRSSYSRQRSSVQASVIRASCTCAPTIFHRARAQTSRALRKRVCTVPEPPPSSSLRRVTR